MGGRLVADVVDGKEEVGGGGSIDVGDGPREEDGRGGNRGPW